MANVKHDKARKNRRVRRVRSKLSGTHDRPRLSVFRSNQHVYAQLIDDGSGQTLAAASDFDLEESGKNKGISRAVGVLLGNRAEDEGIKRAVFDRGASAYHGALKELADGARSTGLDF